MTDVTHTATDRHVLFSAAALAALSLASAASLASRPCDSATPVQVQEPRPPHPCRVDGCSMAPDFDFGYCCDRHDVRYWPGGSVEQRLQADRDFRACVVAAGHPLAAGIYYYAVRVGGSPHLPTRWRWGFGWDYPHGYQEDNE